eukprot:TRINITY_DN3896_c0_g1_i1.p3 TRINITY_DN3896_c0_g1~~TRINITY_DN3896_c0_g1_i1.p3  ORF type:complete len:140 (+),score=21.88 TRINITY_DN3896_c0_g1_i1:908-1327(+)
MFPSECPIYVDHLNPLRANILNFEYDFENIIKEGFLLKESGKLFKKDFVKKWFVLTKHNFCYYESQDLSRRKEYPITRSSVLTRVPEMKFDKKTLLGFEFKPDPSNSILLFCTTIEEQKEWMDSIQKIIDMRSKDLLMI